MSPVNRLLNLLTRRQHARLVEQIAAQLARQCRPAVWDRVRQKTFGMSPAQVRGYVRAHAGGIVGIDADAALSRHRPGRRMHAQVVARATEELVNLVLHHLLDAAPGGGDWARAA